MARRKTHRASKTRRRKAHRSYRRRRHGKRVNRWIQRTGVSRHKGALHRMLCVSRRKDIPRTLLRRKLSRARKVLHSGASRAGGHTRAWWRKLERRIIFALNVPHGRKKRRR